MKGITLINKETSEFKTFWTNVHGQHFISKGIFDEFEYEIGEGALVDKEEGNEEYRKLRKAGWMKWNEFCIEFGIDISKYGYYLF